jgi:hypothetical protein
MGEMEAGGDGSLHEAVANWDTRRTSNYARGGKGSAIIARETFVVSSEKRIVEEVE